MKILSLSLDNKILSKASAVAGRMVDYGRLVEKYTILVPNRKYEQVKISDKVMAYGSGGRSKLAQLFKACRIGEKTLRQEKYDVITAQDQYYLALIGYWLAKKFKLGLELQAHGFEKFYGLRKLIAKFVLPRANAVRTVSQRLKKLLMNDFGVKEEKITVAPIYSELRIMNYELRIKKDTGKFIFLTIGRLVEVKNIGLQIEALAEVVKKYHDAELWIIGDGPERKNYELRITNYGLKGKVKLFGWKNDLDEYYHQANAFVLTSNLEGWGLAVIEAAAAGLPIIMTDVGCAGEVIKDEESGLVIPVGGGRELAAAMIKIIEDENLRNKLGQNAKLAVSRLPAKEQILALYKKSWEKASSVIPAYQAV